MQFTWKAILKSLPASPLIIMSTYFEVLAFMYIGIDFFFSLILSLAVVGMMEYIFQVDAKLFADKKIWLAIILLFVWLIFFGVSIAGNIYSIWDIMDRAKNKRENIAIQNLDESKDIKLLDTQIELLSEKIKMYQEDYKNPANNWWVKSEKIKPNLEQAQKDFDIKILERKQLIESEKEATQNKEIGINQKTGKIDSTLKIVIAVLLAIIVDIGGCIIIMFSWILKKQDVIPQAVTPVQENAIQENIVPENTVNKIRLDAQAFASRLNKPLSWLDKVTRFYDYLVVDYNKHLYGRTSKQFLESGLSVADYNTIRMKAINIGYLKSERKNTWFGAFWDFECDTNIRELFIKGVGNENN